MASDRSAANLTAQFRAEALVGVWILAQCIMATKRLKYLRWCGLLISYENYSFIGQKNSNKQLIWLVDNIPQP